ncbi:MAG: type II secretion system F family protein, partial [Clostridia bacterium]|nr:type II secretion system F family protein [Clostridia bacterium]
YMVLIFILMIIAFITYILQTPDVRLHLDHLKLHLPLMKKPLKTIYTARFAQSLSSLYASGLPMVNAVLISAKVLNNSHITRQFEAVALDIKNGQSLSASIKKVEGFDNKLIATITIGEETGKLGIMLAAMGESFDYEGEIAINRLITLMEPIMIIIMAIIIGSTILSVLLPILTMYQTIG